MANEPRSVDVTGLGQQWEADSQIRQRLRDGGSLLHPSTADKVLIRTASLNGPVLKPLCEMMAKMRDVVDDGKIPPSPAVEGLREEVQAVMGMAKQEVTFEQIDKAAWSIRKFVAFLKLKIRKRQVSTVMIKLKRAFQDPQFQQLLLILDPNLQAGDGDEDEDEIDEAPREDPQQLLTQKPLQLLCPRLLQPQPLQQHRQVIVIPDDVVKAEPVDEEPVAGSPGALEGRSSFDAPSEERASFATDDTQVVDITTVPDPPEAVPADTSDMSAEDQRRAYQGAVGTPTQVMPGTPDHETPSSKVLGDTPPVMRADQLSLKGKKKKGKRSKNGKTAKKKKAAKMGNKKAAPLSPSRRRRSLLRQKSRSSNALSEKEAAADDAKPVDAGLEAKPVDAALEAEPAPETKPKPTRGRKPKHVDEPKHVDDSKVDVGSLEIQMPDNLDDWADLNAKVLLTAFAREWFDHRHDQMADFKLLMREALPGAQEHEAATLNIYWTRFSCGVTIKSTRKDLGSYHLPHKTVPPNLRLAVQFLDMMLSETCPSTGKTYRDLGVETLVALPLVTEVYESLKQDGAEVIDEIASWGEAAK
ncbi:unnamed protein product [Symbiodinium sp. CCMP2456]|nr:unnamed protein product [Symbiodinium sp. CCMP2456]